MEYFRWSVLLLDGVLPEDLSCGTSRVIERFLSEKAFDFDPENIQTVKDSIRLSSTGAGTLYGKTGTGRVDGQDINGWFIGFIETPDNTYFFCTNIQSEANATGSSATEITLSILEQSGSSNKSGPAPHE